MATTKRSTVPVVQTSDRALFAFSEAVRENIELMLGQRGDPLDRVATLRDLQAIGFDVSPVMGARGVVAPKQASPTQSSAAIFDARGAVVDAEYFARQIYQTKLFQELAAGMNDPDRFGWVPEQLRKELSNSIAEEALKRGSDIRHVEQIVQSASASFAKKLEEITVAYAGFAAGIRSMSFAYADADRAIAANVTQVEARLDGVDVSADTLGVGGTTGGAAYATLTALKAAVPTGVTSPARKYYKVANPVAGQPDLIYTWDTATSPAQYKLAGRGTTAGAYFAGVEQTLKASTDRTTGSEAQYAVKVTAGGAVAGFGLAATDNGAGNASSAFIVQADRFAIVNSSYAGGLTLSPSSANIPFGVDSSGVYINGTVRINAGGVSLADIGRPANFLGSFASEPSTTGLFKNTFYANTTNGNSYVLDADDGAWQLMAKAGAAGAAGANGTNGTNGTNGAAGTRGSLTLYTSGSSWSDAVADAAILAASYSSAHVIGDTVTIASSGFAATKYWSGFGWVDPGVTINGNLLVNGTISGAKIAADAIDGKTITGATVQTAYSGRRVVLDSSGFSAYDSYGTTVMKVSTLGQFGAVDINPGSAWGYGLSVNGSCSGSNIYVNNSHSSGIAVQAISNYKAIVGSSGGGGMAGHFYYGFFNPETMVAAYVGGTPYGVYTNGQMKSVLPTGTAPIDVTSTTLCPNLTAAALGNASNRYVISGGAVGGSSLGSFLANKPGSASSNGWLQLTIDGSVYWVPIWPN